MAKLPLVEGGHCLISDEDYQRLSQNEWHLHNRGYAVRYEKGKSILLHREVLSDAEGVVDHINGNRLDNRRENLREISTHHNNMNRAANTSKKYSAYKGVCWSKAKGAFVAHIKLNGKQMHLGYFSTEVEAAQAYNEKAKELFGEFARLNDVPPNARWFENRIGFRKSEHYMGVSQRGDKFQARITHNGKRLSLGYFTTERAAAEAYNVAAIKLKGEKALINKFK